MGHLVKKCIGRNASNIRYPTIPRHRKNGQGETEGAHHQNSLGIEREVSCYTSRLRNERGTLPPPHQASARNTQWPTPPPAPPLFTDIWVTLSWECPLAPAWCTPPSLITPSCMCHELQALLTRQGHDTERPPLPAQPTRSEGLC